MTISMKAFSQEIEKQAVLGTLLTAPIRDALYWYASDRPKDKERAKAVREKLLEVVSDVKLRQGARPTFERKGDQKHITVRKDEAPAILAHELGHAEIDDSFIGRMAQSPVGRTAPVSVGNLLGAVALGRGQHAAGTASVAAGFVPVLAQEALASIKGVRKLREAGASEEELADAKKRLLAAWGTYATLPVAMVGDVLSIGAVIRALSGG